MHPALAVPRGAAPAETRLAVTNATGEPKGLHSGGSRASESSGAWLADVLAEAVAEERGGARCAPGQPPRLRSMRERRTSTATLAMRPGRASRLLPASRGKANIGNSVIVQP